MRHIGALSGGKDSTAMALRLTELYPKRRFQWVCTPTGNEPDAWFQHMQRLRDLLAPGDLLGILPISTSTLDGLIKKYGSLPSWRQRWCTRQLKIEPFAAYVARNAPCRIYVGLRADEPEREGGDYYRDIAQTEMVFPLRQWGWGMAEVVQYLEHRGIEIPRRTDCSLCFFQTLQEWWELWHDNPAEYARGEAYEAQTGHTWRSPGRDTKPTSLRELRAWFEDGGVPGAAGQLDMFRSQQCRVCRM
jgi:3'-phosphoadenosine 5'-phosphosulfate sulfotransferase (PAPS reductase)/FAD synthetase